ncbi:CHAT domain-containing protein [Pseudonocardia endophytica]|uniref:CHAT domain-containing protein n=1 Tax=Pseudonocardia endophytica TaxID=401976 RepID=A0A4R1HK74_PSEEN|nr:CHAT domain-containing protein [Pseudonocardia endophytica]TCK22268.1 CHAT domain-containing protein [Pseudonocardia endophytica]
MDRTLDPTAGPSADELARLGSRLIERAIEAYVAPTDARDMLDEAVDALRAAVAATLPDDPAIVPRHRDLGCALDLRAELTGNTDDLTEAVGWTRRAWRGAPHPDVDRGGLAIDLGMVLLRDAEARDVSPVPALEAEAARASDPRAYAVLSMFAGTARLLETDPEETALFTGHLTELANGLTDVPDMVPLLGDALTTVCRAATMTGHLDLAADALDRLRALPDPGVEPADMDLLEAGLVEARMWRDEDPAAAARVIGLLRRVRAERPDDLDVSDELAEWLVMQAELTDDPSGIAEALALLGDPLARPGDERVEMWHKTGNAHLLRWRLAGSDDDRDRADGCFAAMLSAGPVDPGTALAGLAYRLELVEDRARRTRDSALRPMAATLLDDANAALERAVASGEPDAAAVALTAMPAVALDLWFAGEGSIHIDRIRRLIALAAAHPEPPPEWHTRLGIARVAVADHDAVVSGRPADGNAVLTAIRDSDHSDEVGPLMAPLFAVHAMTDAFRTADLAQLNSAITVVEQHGPDGRAFARLARLFAAVIEGTDLETLRTAVAEAQEEIDGSGSGNDPLRAMLDWLGEMLAGRAPAGPPAVAGDSDVPGPFQEAMGSIARIMDLTARMRTAPDHDARRLLAEMAAMVEADANGPLRHNGLRPACTTQLSLMWTDRARAVPTDREAVENAVLWSDRTLAELPGPEHPRWGPSSSTAAEARRLRDAPGDRAASRRLGADALRGRTRLVLGQSGSDEAVRVARSAAADAMALARQCAGDGAADDLVAALEAGRGLVLHAALTTRDVATRLRAQGRTELADEWERSGGRDLLDAEVPALAGSGLSGDLWRRVLDALADDPAGLLDPPSLPEIRSALRVQGSDALVYLLPGDGDEPGLAVVVPAGAEVEVLALPGLRDEPNGAIDRYAEAYQRAHREGGDRAIWSSELGDLTGWAWETVVAALLPAVRAHAVDPGLPRIVLVPVGRAALVPWHAARPRGGDPVETLAVRAVVSHTPSGRLLCRSVGRSRAVDGRALVLGAPAGSGLSKALEEAHALHRRYYPDGDYLGPGSPGIHAAGPGDRDDVLDRLAGDRSHSVVHLACHGNAEPDDPARSALELADGALTVADLLERRPTAPLTLDTVVLAACSTNVGGADYDEAFSLATAFLAAGARSAVGSLWAVPDSFTSGLMIRLHHYLRVEGLPPAEALHRARAWAVDPAARTTAPELELQRSPRDDPLAWAGFVHLGA